MSITMKSNPLQPLDARDPGLPFLASQAAIELDNLLLGKSCGPLTAVDRLAGRLENSTTTMSGTQDRRSLMDPVTVSVLSSAVAASGHTEIRTLGELAAQASRLAFELHGTKNPSNKEKLESLRSFCVFLSQSAVAHERSLYESHASNRDWS